MTGIMPVALLSRPVVQVRQKAKVFELRNEYDLLDGDGASIGEVSQVNQSPFTVAARIVSDLDVALPVELEVRQGSERVLLLRKPWLRMTVGVSNAAGGDVGTIRKRIRMGRARFELLDLTGLPLGAVRAENWRAKDFVVEDANGQQAARVTKTWAGMGREVFTDADHYTIERPPELQEPLRSLALAAPFAIDLVMKQKDAG